MKSRVVFALLAAVVLATACGADTPGGRGGSLDGAWGLRSATVDGGVVALLDNHRVTLTIAGDEAGGRAACNGYGSMLRIEGGTVAFVNLGSNDMACEPSVMDVEAAYLSALIRVNSAVRAESALRLTGPGVVLEFALLAPAPTAYLVGVTWMLSEIVQGDTVTSPAEGADGPGEKGWLLLSEDGTLAGSTGCRRLSGEYVVRGDEIVFTSFSADGDCVAELWWQDNQVVTMLGDGFTAEIVGRRLIVSSTGGEGLVFRVADPTPETFDDGG